MALIAVAAAVIAGPASAGPTFPHLVLRADAQPIITQVAEAWERIGPDLRRGVTGDPFGPDYSARTFGYEAAPAPFYSYRPHRPRVVAPTPLSPRITVGVPKPWTARWYAYCSDRYRSFDRDTGTYLTYGGERRRCR
jgi:hypothetical protein